MSATGGSLRYTNATISNAAEFDIQAGVTLNLSGIRSGPCAVTKVGPGNLILGGDGSAAALHLTAGHTGLSALSTGKGTALHLSNGATLAADTRQIFGSGTLDGQKLPSGIYKPNNSAWVTAGQANIGAIGTMILLR